MASLDVLAFGARYSPRTICAAIDAKRGEVFYAFYQPVPGGVTRTTAFEVASPALLSSELVARREDMLVIGTGALSYRKELEEAGSHVEIASLAHAHPQAGALVELAIPRLVREEHDRLYDLKPIYVRRSDAEIAWDQRRRTG
jgi:tRNA threonylcarbamoyladenosine biosynthesis protein TsaB